jgi:hypothetical protein
VYVVCEYAHSQSCLCFYTLGLAWDGRRPRTALAIMLSVVLAMAPGLLRLQIRTDGHSDED